MAFDLDDMVERVAKKIIDMPADRREEGLRLVREKLVEVAKKADAGPTAVDNFVDETMSAIEERINVMEAWGRDLGKRS